MTEELELLRQADPVSADEGPWRDRPLTARAEARLAALTAGAVPRGRPRPVRRLPSADGPDRRVGGRRRRPGAHLLRRRQQSRRRRTRRPPPARRRTVRVTGRARPQGGGQGTDGGCRGRAAAGQPSAELVHEHGDGPGRRAPRNRARGAHHQLERRRQRLGAGRGHRPAAPGPSGDPRQRRRVADRERRQGPAPQDLSGGLGGPAQRAGKPYQAPDGRRGAARTAVMAVRRGGRHQHDAATAVGALLVPSGVDAGAAGDGRPRPDAGRCGRSAAGGVVTDRLGLAAGRRMCTTARTAQRIPPARW